MSEINDVLFWVHDANDDILLDYTYLNKGDNVEVSIVCPYTNSTKGRLVLDKSAFNSTEAENKVKDTILELINQKKEKNDS